MKPNFTEMTVSELRAYVLANRNDDEAILALFHHPTLKYTIMPPMFTEEGQPIEKNIRQAEETFHQLIEKEQS